MDPGEYAVLLVYHIPREFARYFCNLIKIFRTGTAPSLFKNFSKNGFATDTVTSKTRYLSHFKSF